MILKLTPYKARYPIEAGKNMDPGRRERAAEEGRRDQEASRTELRDWIS